MAQPFQIQPTNYEVQIVQLDTAWEVTVTKRQGGQMICRALVRSRDCIGKLLELLWL